MNRTQVKVLLVEDNQSLRDGLATAISATRRDLMVSGSFGSPSQVLRALDGLGWGGYDVGLIDLGLREYPGEELIRRLVRRCPNAPLIALTVRTDSEALFGALRAGAVGCLFKDSPISALTGALDDAVAGGSPLSPLLARHLVRSLQATNPTFVPTGLTSRESQVLDLLCSGASYREVASRLTLAEGTVQTYVKKVYEKLGVTSKAEAVRMALESRLIPVRDGV